MRTLFLTFLLLAVSVSATFSTPKRTLQPPKPDDVLAFGFNVLAPAHDPVFVRYTIQKEQILEFLQRGNLRAYDADRVALRDLAPLSPPPQMSFQDISLIAGKLKMDQPEDFAWRSRLYAIAEGALATRDGRMIFWRLENDRVLYLATEEEACYLVLN